MEHDINYVLFGYSPDQVGRYFYEIPKTHILHDLLPIFNSNGSLNGLDQEYYINSKEINSESIPRVLLPYHVMHYQEDSIISLIESKKLVKKGNADPLKTNCFVVAASLFYDINRYGIIPYLFQYAELVRLDPSIRNKWLRTLKMLSPLIMQGKFNEKGVNTFFERIGISKEEIMNKIDLARIKDPNNTQIIMALSYIKKKY